jgi:DHA1 family inner membrane transport protein
MVTAYALGISIGGPTLAVLSASVCRRRLLITSLSVFVVSNFVACVSSLWLVLLGSRFVMGSVHGLFIGVGSVIAASLALPGGEGRAMSVVFGGVAAATVLGVPLGVLLAHVMGWRVLFAAIAILAIVAVAAAAMLLNPTEAPRSRGLRGQARAALSPRVLLMLVVAMLLLGGQFTAFTYIAPFLHNVTHVDGETISLYLLAYGAASAVGVFIGGRLADANAPITLIIANAVLTVTMGELYLLGSDAWAAAGGLAIWGAVGFGLVPALQLRIVQLAGDGRDLAATFSASAVNVGIALGSLLGGWVLAAYDPMRVVLAAGAICLVALPVTAASGLLRTRARSAGGGAMLGSQPAAQ